MANPKKGYQKKMVHTVYVDVLSDAWPEELPTDIKLAA
jgi:hypothetical protein